MDGFRKPDGGLVFNAALSMGIAMQVRCGQCIGCRLYRSREWAVRMVHEAQMHSGSMFLTLTYDDDHLPVAGTLVPEDHQRFLKRLRKRVGSFRYYHCGEYGTENLRPHYHCALFGYRDPDLFPWSTSPSGHTLYRSPIVEAAWQAGHVVVGELTMETAQYVASYTTKKLTVSKASSELAYRRWQARYQRVNPLTGEIIELTPEYSTSSNRPGIGARWFEKYRRDVYPSDFVVVNGKKFPPPRYYDQLLERSDPLLFKEVKRRRRDERERSDDAPHRLEAMEKCALARTNLTGGRNA